MRIQYSVFIVISLLLAIVQANLFPKFPKLVLKYDETEEEGVSEMPLFKFPKLDLFAKPSLKEKLEEKKAKEAMDKEEFQSSMVDFFEDKDKAKKVVDRLQIHKLITVPEEPNPCDCNGASKNNCDDEIKYFS
ncbi:uncharacterized protein LOC142229451 [Haematobia irritans]|uniref:uncharacterized protein LOC142229451 n=1 Tax=Haematobia irritans TaxID=7368 RepID=UPI003F509E10